MVDTIAINTELATNIGLEQAIVLSTIRTWHNFHKHYSNSTRDGYVWMLTSKKMLRETLPFLSDRVICSSVDKLNEQGFIVRQDNDKSFWVALTPDGLKLFEGGEVSIVKPETAKKPTLSVEEKRAILREKCEPYVAQYGRPMIEAFLNYWGEANGNEIRCEVAKRKSGAFEIARRLATWASKDYNQTPAQPVQPSRPKKEIWEELGITREQYLEMHKK